MSMPSSTQLTKANARATAAQRTRRSPKKLGRRGAAPVADVVIGVLSSVPERRDRAHGLHQSRWTSTRPAPRSVASRTPDLPHDRVELGRPDHAAADEEEVEERGRGQPEDAVELGGFGELRLQVVHREE